MQNRFLIILLFALLSFGVKAQYGYTLIQGPKSFKDTCWMAKPLKLSSTVTWSALDATHAKTAYSWGNHSGLYSLLGHNHTGTYEPVISKSTGYLYYNGSAWVWKNETYLKTESDPTFLASQAASITSTNISNWNMASSLTSTPLQLSSVLTSIFYSPAFTGVPTAPTASVGTNTTQVATTAFVLANSSTGTSTSDSIMVSASIPSRGNVFISSVDNRIHYKSGDHWYRVAIEDSTSYSSLITGLVSYWTLDETTSTYKDENGVNTLTVQGTPTRGETKLIGGTGAKSVKFLAMGDNCVAPDDVSLDLTTNFSVSVWIKPTSTAGVRTILSKGDLWDQTMGGYILYIQDSILNVEIGTGSVNYTDVAALYYKFKPNNTYHIVFTHTATTENIYVNDTLRASNTTTVHSPSAGTYTLLLAENNNANSARKYTFLGWMDDVALWNRPLTLAEIHSIYNSGTGEIYPF